MLYTGSAKCSALTIIIYEIMEMTNLQMVTANDITFLRFERKYSSDNIKYKINSTTDALQVEAILQKQLSDPFHLRKRKCC